MDNRLDGNAAAGTLQAIFGREMTRVRAVCNGCGATNPIGSTAAYMSAMGTVVRCPVCDKALIRVVQGNGYYWLDLRGVRVLQITQISAEA
jgi:ribosomal protein S27E